MRPTIVGPMRVMVVGSGGVGTAMAMAARRRECFESVVLTDIDGARARTAAERSGDPRIRGVALDAGDVAAIVELARHERADAKIGRDHV